MPLGREGVVGTGYSLLQVLSVLYQAPQKQSQRQGFEVKNFMWEMKETPEVEQRSEKERGRSWKRKGASLSEL